MVPISRSLRLSWHLTIGYCPALELTRLLIMGWFFVSVTSKSTTSFFQALTVVGKANNGLMRITHIDLREDQEAPFLGGVAYGPGKSRKA
jgi:hypothetical protein